MRRVFTLVKSFSSFVIYSLPVMQDSEPHVPVQYKPPMRAHKKAESRSSQVNIEVNDRFSRSCAKHLLATITFGCFT